MKKKETNEENSQGSLDFKRDATSADDYVQGFFARTLEKARQIGAKYSLIANSDKDFPDSFGSNSSKNFAS
jgi:hypothetical protein